MYLIQFCLSLWFLSWGVTCAPISKYTQIASAKALIFMKTYGYIEEDNGDAEALYTEEGISEIIKLVQKFGAIEETGKIDNATLALMSSRRCGVPDIIKNNRQKRYVFGSEGWWKRHLTYFIVNWTPKLGEYAVMKNIQRALDTWGSYGRLNFQRVSNNDADIVVSFATGDHGDAFPFDGRGGVLGHAFFPFEGSDIGGDIHFDADEEWVDDNADGIEGGTHFYSVALHELGHSLGLSHSPVPTAVMFPYYQNYELSSDYHLDYDDILGMYDLYIKRVLKEDESTSSPEDRHETTSTTNVPTHPTQDWHTSSTTDYSIVTSTEPPTTRDTYQTSEVTNDSDPSTTSRTEVTYEGDNETVDDHKEHDSTHNIPNTNSPSLPNICDGYVDAVATLRDELFVFKENFIWRFKEKGELEPGYPVPISQMFPKLPREIKRIDAAYERPDGMIVIFTGKMYWVYDGTNFIESSPKSLAFYELPNYLDNIDGVQIWGRNKKTYFYKNDRFWRYNETTKSMDPGYPRHIERWRGVPENIDAATTWKDGATYFFKGQLFWKFDNDFVIVTQQSPLPTAQIWFGCPEEPNMLRRLFPE